MNAGERIGPYEVSRLLGQGGMGEVYLGRDHRLHRDVAIKLVRTAANESIRQHFEQEAELAPKIVHPFVATVFDVLEIDGTTAIVMEFVEGVRLDERLASQPGRDRTLRYFREMAEALEAIHQGGLVHRDLKPSNVLITRDDHAKVIDLGLAVPAPAELDGLSHETTWQQYSRRSRTAGTLPYMSPEQLRGQSLDPRSDLFSLGVMLFEAVRGSHPFHRSTPVDTASAILHEEPELLSERSDSEEGDRRLEQLIARLLDKEAAKRPGSAAEVAAALREIRRHRSNPARQPRRSRIAALAVVAALALPVAWLLLGIGSDLDAGRQRATSTSPETEAGDLLVQRALAKAGDYDYQGAIALLENALSDDPELLRARITLAGLLHGAGYGRRAREELSHAERQAKAIGVGAESLLGVELEAARARVLFRGEEAVARYSELTRRVPDRTDLLLDYADELHLLSRDREALDINSRALALNDLEPRIKLQRATLLASLGRGDEATELIERAQSLYEVVDSASGTARVTEERAAIAEKQGDFEAAAELYQQAADHYRQNGDALARVRAERRAGDSELRLYRLDAAAEHYQGALPSLREAGHYAAVVEILHSLGKLEQNRQDLPASEAWLREAADEARKLENDRLLMPSLVSLAANLLYQGRGEEARQPAAESLELAARLQDADQEGQARTLLARIDFSTGEVDTAIDRLAGFVHSGEAWPRLTRSRQVFILGYLARLQEQAERLGAALVTCRRAVELGSDAGARSELPFALALLAEVEAQVGLLEDARQSLAGALTAIEADGTVVQEQFATWRPKAMIALMERRWQHTLTETSGKAPQTSWIAPALHLLAAEALLQLGSAEQAAERASEVVAHPLAFATDRAKAAVVAAGALEALGRLEEAEATARDAALEASALGLNLTTARARSLVDRMTAGTPNGPGNPAITGVQAFLAAAPDDRRLWLQSRWDIQPILDAARPEAAASTSTGG